MVTPRAPLADRVAIVTGGNEGIGKAISLAFAEAGASVVIAHRKADIGEELATRLQATGRRFLVVSADVTRSDQVASMTEKTVAEFGRIDVLVNNAGGVSGVGFRSGRVLKTSEADWDAVIAVNLKSVFLCSQAVGPVMLAQKKGTIINIASLAGQVPFAGLPAYSAAKAAVISLTKSLAMELAPHVRVNAIAAGIIDTPRSRLNRSPEQTEHLVSNILLDRIGQPEEVASMAVYLASDAAEWITGSIMDVHGGQSYLAEWGKPYFRT